MRQSTEIFQQIIAAELRNMTKARILVLESDLAVAQQLGRWLESWQCAVITPLQGDLATLRGAIAQQPDLIIVAIQLDADWLSGARTTDDKRDGITLAEQIQALAASCWGSDRPLPGIIYLTTELPDPLLERAQATDPCNIILKPLQPEAVRVAIAVAQQQQRLQQQVLLVKQTNAKLMLQMHERTAHLQQALGYHQLVRRVAEQVQTHLEAEAVIDYCLQTLSRVLESSYCWVALYNDQLTTATITLEVYGDRAAMQRSLEGSVDKTNGKPRSVVGPPIPNLPNGLPNHFAAVLEFGGSGHRSVTLGSEIQMVDFPHLYPHLLEGKSWQSFAMDNPVDPYRRLINQDGKVLISPIRDRHHTIGELGVVSTSQELWSTEHIDLLEQLAGQCAIAIRQSQLRHTSQTQIQELEQLSQLKDDFVSSLSNELRTPLTNMKLALRILQQLLHQQGLHDLGSHNLSTPNLSTYSLDTQNRSLQSGKSTDATTDSPDSQPPDTAPHLPACPVTPPRQLRFSRITEYLRIMEQECQRQTNFINDLLNFKSLDDFTEISTTDTLELQQWLPELVQRFQPRATLQHLQLACHVSPAVPLVRSQSHKLEQILAELLTNACKYTPAGGEILVSAELYRRQVKLSVLNTGPEIPPMELRRIFDPFYRVDQGDRWQHPGTGFGLALVKRLVIRLCGEIDVESHDGINQFIIRLPIG